MRALTQPGHRGGATPDGAISRVRRSVRSKNGVGQDAPAGQADRSHLLPSALSVARASASEGGKLPNDSVGARAPKGPEAELTTPENVRRGPSHMSATSTWTNVAGRSYYWCAAKRLQPSVWLSRCIWRSSPGIATRSSFQRVGGNRQEANRQLEILRIRWCGA